MVRYMESCGRDASPAVAVRFDRLRWPLSLVRPEGAKHLWRRVPPSELSIELVADGRRGRVTGLVEAP